MGFDDPRNQGLLALAAGLMAPSRGGSFGGAALQGLQGYQQAYGNASQIQGQQEQLKLMRDKYAFQMEGAEKDRKKQDALTKFAEQYASTFQPKPQGQMTAPTVDALGQMPPVMGTQPVRSPDVSMGTLNTPPVDPIAEQRRQALMGMALNSNDPMTALQALVTPKPRDVMNVNGRIIDKENPGQVLADYSDPKLTPLQQTMQAAGIDLKSPEAQSIMRQAVLKASTHAPAASVKIDNKMGPQETEQAKAYGKGLGGIRESIMTAGLQAPQTIANYQAIGNALDGLGGGNLEGAKTVVASTLNSVGIKVDPRLGDKEFAEALGREMAAGMRQTGTGPMTDKDFENFLKRVPDMSKSPEGRKQIIATAIAKAERDREVMRMATEYAAKNNGNIDDNFLVQVSQFVAKRPVVSAPVKQQSFGAGWSIKPIQ